MKILHISDLHFGKLLFEYSLLPDQRYWCRQVLDFLEDNPHDVVVIAGDLYDRAVPSGEAVELLDSFLCGIAAMGLPVLSVSGNHDSGRRLGFGRSLLAAGGVHMAALPQARIEQVTLRDSCGEVDFWLLPYITPADGRNLFPEQEIHSYNDCYRVFIEQNRDRIVPGRRNVLVAHGFFSMLSDGVDSIAVTSDSELSLGGMDIVDAGCFAGFDYCAFGHLHAPQRVGSDSMRYSGSPLPYSVSEEHQQKGLLSITLDGDGNVTAKTTQLAPLHRLYSVTGTLEELEAATAGRKVSDDYVFVNIVTHGEELAAAQRVRNLYPNYLGIRYHDREEQELLLGGGDILRRRTIPEAFGEFYQGVTGRSLTAHEQLLVAAAAAGVSAREEEKQ